MITADMIQKAQKRLIEEWGEDGKRVIEAAAKVTPFNGDTGDFLNHCVTCGGNWGGMFLSGIKKLFPEVWDAIPMNGDDGNTYFFCICYTMILCGVDTSK